MNVIFKRQLGRSTSLYGEDAGRTKIIGKIKANVTILNDGVHITIHNDKLAVKLQELMSYD